MADSDVKERAQSKDLEKEVNRYAVDDMDLAGLSSLAELGELLASEGVTTTESYDENYSSGFAVESKDSLVGKPFYLVQWRFNTSKSYFDDNGDPIVFVSAYAVTYDDKKQITGKYILNDGSTGIASQLRAVTDMRVNAKHAHPQAGLWVRHGLRKSEYDVEIDGKPRHGVTYYLS